MNNKNNSNESSEKEKEESFRQNASFAEKILLNEGIFTRSNDEHDVRKITRARIENMLYAMNLRQIEAPVNIHLGRQGINSWIWENKILIEIPTSILKEYLYHKMTNDAMYFYKEYSMIHAMVQKVAGYLKIPINLLRDEMLLDETVLSYLDSSFATSKLKQRMITYLAELTSHSQRNSEFISLMLPELQHREDKLIHPKIQEYIKQLTKEGKAEATKKNVLRYMNMLLPWLTNNMRDFTTYEPHNIPFLTIKEVHLLEFRAYLLKKQRNGEYSPITVSECIYAVKNFFLFLKKTYGFPDPSRKLKSFKAPRYRFRNLPSDEQIQTFFNVIETYSDNPLLERTAFQFMLTLGLRSMEVAQVSWNDINMGIRTIRIHSKGGKYHELPLAGRLYEDLKIHSRNAMSSNYIFGKSPKIALQMLQQNYKLYCLIAGWTFPGGLHLFRHAFVTNLAGKQAPPQVLKALARVIKMDTVSLYTHLNQRTNWLSREVNKLNYGLKGDM